MALPDVFSADLDADELARLLGDVVGMTTVLGVTLKDGARSHVAPESETSDEPRDIVATLLAKVRAGLALPLGVQLRYLHQGVVFYDTLMQRGGSWRLTRFAPPHDQPR